MWQDIQSKDDAFTGSVMKQRKDRLWNFKASDDLIDRLIRYSTMLDRPASQIAREAIGKKLDELADEFPQLKAADEAAKEVTPSAL